MTPDQLIIFLRAPILGTVKQRLAASLGPASALEVYQKLVRTVLDRVSSCPNVQLRFTPDDAADRIRLWLRPIWRTRPQGSGDLGARMHRGFAEAFEEGARRVVLIGSDCPSITFADIEAAWSALAETDLVLGPAADGGYWLIGLRQPQPALFQEISWSTNMVFSETLARARASGLLTALLSQRADIDTEADWAEFLRSPR